MVIADDGADPATPPLVGRINSFKDYTTDTNPNGSGAYDLSGHGTVVADILGGAAAGIDGDYQQTPYPGGVAPGATLDIQRICAGSDPSASTCVFDIDKNKDAVALGARVINFSLGSGNVLADFTGPADSGLSSYTYHLQPLVDGDVLAVWSAGNEHQGQVGDSAGLPYWAPSFKNNWLVVGSAVIDTTAGDADYGKVTALASYSNACGVAADWCLVAPGNVMIPPDLTVPNVAGTGYTQGTSFAAPIVSGTAALVFEAFPWMTAHNAQQTILTTATHVADGSATDDPTKPNATYGWGLVNAGKAVYGPAQFDDTIFGPFQANLPGGAQSAFANAISGTGSLVLGGAGTLVLSADNTYTGATTVNSGMLVVDGSITSPVTTGFVAGTPANGDTAAAPAVFGTLAGTGVVHGDVTNNGALTSAGSKAGQGLTITGNLANGANSTTSIALGNPLTVGGTATLDGIANVLAQPTGYTVQSKETLLNAGNVTGTFANLTFSTGVFYTGTLNYQSNQVSVSLVQSSVSTTAQGWAVAAPQTLTSASNVQKALDVSNVLATNGQTAGHSEWFDAAGKFLAAPTAPVAAASLDSLSGEIYATGRAVAMQQSLAADAALSNRERALAFNAKPGAWAQAFGANGTLARSGYDAAGYSAGGAMVGVDGQVADSLAVGVAFGTAQTTAHMDGLGGVAHARETLGAVYARLGDTTGWYGAGRVSLASVAGDVSRNVLLGSEMDGLTASHGDHVTAGTFELGKTYASGNDGTSVTPYLALTDLYYKQGAFTERGSAMGLSAKTQSHNAVFGTLGLRYATGFDWTLGHTTLEGSIALRHALHGADLGMTASFAGLPGVDFTAQGQNLPRTAGLIGLRTSTAINAQWSFYLDADYQHGSNGFHQAEANAGLRFAF